MIDRVLVLGCGYAGTAVAKLARERGLAVVANLRSEARAESLRAQGFDVLQRAAGLDETIAEHVTPETHVVVAFPPDGTTESRIARSLSGAAAITFLSSTGVYGSHRGVVDDATPVAAVTESERSARLLAAERAFQDQGATVLRCPALYGPDRGLHVRVLRGEHRIPGDGSRYLSRIHVADLALFVLARLPRGESMVVGDLEPAPHIDVVRFICDAYGAPMPGFVPLESVHESLRADRRIDPSRALAAAGITLRYPSYRDGMAPAATRISPHTI